jgi:predicted Fe-Mo cluster-binding NifX family protein
MKVAVTIFKEGVSPRLDIADSLWIYQIDKDREIATLKEKCGAACEQADQLIGLLKEKGISTVVCGGCPQYLLRMLTFHGVEIVPGVMGEPGDIVNRLAQGKLSHTLPALDGLTGRYCRHGHPGGARGRYGRRKNKNIRR